MSYPRGSEWRKWDLHVHTPDSLVQGYGGNTDEVWKRYLKALQALPSEMRVLGINDYLFIDGYRKLLAAKEMGYLPNIDLLLPVIELRLAQFCTTKGAWQRVNFHIIFSDELAPDDIEREFLSQIRASYQLSPKRGDTRGPIGVSVTRETMTQFGQELIESVPAGEKGKFDSPLKVGFDNANFRCEELLAILERSSVLRGRYLTAIGKTEWAALSWNDHSVAEKRDVINRVDLVFTAAETPDAYHRARASLQAACVTDRLLDCSDAHYFADSGQKERLGYCFTWLKADPTFQGLRHALTAFEDRVFVGDVPPKVRAVRENPTLYIDRVAIRKNPQSALPEQWFDCEIPLNAGFIAIIGNKGTGKSALADAIALLGNTRRSQFSFLNDRRFRKGGRRSRADHFTATLTWHSGLPTTRSLADDVPEAQVEQVGYVPQDFFERVCNEVDIARESEFGAELQRVIFSHVEEEDRLGYDDLDSLIHHRKSEIEAAIDTLRGRLGRLNDEIARIEQYLSPRSRAVLESELAAAQERLRAHDAIKPEPVPLASFSAEQSRLQDIADRISEIREEESFLRQTLRDAISDKDAAEQVQRKVEAFAGEYEALCADCADLEALTGIPISQVVQLQVDQEPLEAWITGMGMFVDALRTHLDPANPESPLSECQTLQEEQQGILALLAAENQAHEQYQIDLAEWEQTRREILGDENSQGSVRYCEARLKRLESLPDALRQRQQARRRLTYDIFRKIEGIADVFRALARPVQGFIATTPQIGDDYDLEFRVSVEHGSFAEQFLQRINQGVRGTFYGAGDGRRRLRAMMDAHDMNTAFGVLRFATKVVGALTVDLREGSGDEVALQGQLKGGCSVKDLYDLVFGLSWLVPEYELRQGGKSLQELSPGERGVLLLIFYLLVDKARYPLVIDQPEGNLDSQSVVKLLAPCVRRAKEQRQLIIVTHSPNLAVVCDAEQVIHATIDKTSGYQIDYRTGSIENSEMNIAAVNVLEGTPPAFRDRQQKYHTLGPG